MKKILVVGAGFAGACYARMLAEHGCSVVVIDKRPHIAGNCYDYMHDTGVRVHAYGPHLFHTSNQRVVDWLSRFTDWTPYAHKVVARLSDNRKLPLPINLDTVNAIFGLTLESEIQVRNHLKSISEKILHIKNAEDWLYANIGKELTNLFFRPYTKKMWDLDLADIDTSVVQRIKIRTDRSDLYFPNDNFQAMPTDGYTALFSRIFDHTQIEVHLSTPFEEEMLDQFDYCFNSMPIDEYFGFKFGRLPYRSIRFHLTQHSIEQAESYTTVNYTDDGPFTRETWWHNIPNHWDGNSRRVLRSIEEPCDYRDNNDERYYPVKSSDGIHDRLYERYCEEARGLIKMNFIGRCGTYQYLDMHQVINQSLAHCQNWLSSQLNV
ncbi:UDP-galactopyranose mutase [Methylorubrum extorquens]